MGQSSLWIISRLRHQTFYIYIRNSATQVRESDDRRHAMSPFSLVLSSFSGTQRILGYVRPQRIVAVHPPNTGKRRSIWKSLWIGTAFAQRCDVIGLQMLLWRMLTLNWDTARLKRPWDPKLIRKDFIYAIETQSSSCTRVRLPARLGAWWWFSKVSLVKIMAQKWIWITFFFFFFKSIFYLWASRGSIHVDDVRVFILWVDLSFKTLTQGLCGLQITYCDLSTLYSLLTLFFLCFTMEELVWCFKLSAFRCLIDWFDVMSKNIIKNVSEANYGLIWEEALHYKICTESLICLGQMD